MTLRHSPTRSAEGGPGTPELLGPLCAKGLAGLRPPPAFCVCRWHLRGDFSPAATVGTESPVLCAAECAEALPGAAGSFSQAGHQPLGPDARGLHWHQENPFLCPHP